MNRAKTASCGPYASSIGQVRSDSHEVADEEPENVSWPENSVRPGPYHVSGTNLRTTNEQENRSLDESVRPGSYHVSGTNLRTTNEQENRSLDELNTRDLPVAAIVETMQEEIIVGVVVERSTLGIKKHKINVLYIFFSIVAMGTVYGFVLKKGRDSNLDSNQSNQSPTSPPTVSLSPTMSSAPTMDRLEKIKEVLIPVSGTEILEDPSSIQHKAWHLIAERDTVEISVTDEKQIIQSYVAGVIMFSIANFQNVEHFELAKNSFLDACDVFICNKKKEITSLVIFNNYDLGGRGTIPREIGELRHLTHLLLRNNDSSGTIPTEIGLLTNLTHLDLGQNTFYGSIPTEIGFLKKVEWLILSDNNLSQTIPKEIGDMRNLRFPSLSNNILSGSIPREILSLENLEGMELQGNDLTGDVKFLCDLQFTGDTFHLDPDMRNRLYYGKSMYNISLLLVPTVDCQSTMETAGCTCCVCG